jgi:hypothetical protein
MNIFIFDFNLNLNAKMYPNCYTYKIPLELAQMLCTAYRELVEDDDRLYKTSHFNHPCSKWIRDSYANFKYAIDLFYALHDEWNYRYQHNKMHKSFEVINIVEKINPNVFPKQGITKFAQVMPEQYKQNNPVKAYREYFNGEKLHLAQWKNRNIPDWVNIKKEDK